MSPLGTRESEHNTETDTGRTQFSADFVFKQRGYLELGPREESVETISGDMIDMNERLRR